MTNPTAAPNRNINQIMNSGDVGGFIQKNQKLLIAGFIVLVIGIIGFGYWGQVSEKEKGQFNTKIFEFEQGPLKKYSETGVDAKELVSSFMNLKSVVKNYAGLFPLTIKVSDTLILKQNLPEALQVLEVGNSISKNEYNSYFVNSRLAVVYEDLNQDDKAIEVLLKMNSSKLKIFEGKNYLDLGRLYLKKGDKEKAKSSLQYVVEKANTEAEFVKLAKLYLAKL